MGAARRRPTRRESSSAVQPGRIGRPSGRSSKFVGELNCRFPPRNEGQSPNRNPRRPRQPCTCSTTSRCMQVWEEPVSSSATQSRISEAVVLLYTVILVVKEASSSVIVSPTRLWPSSGSESVSAGVGAAQESTASEPGFVPLARRRNGSKTPKENQGNHGLKAEDASAVRG